MGLRTRAIGMQRAGIAVAMLAALACAVAAYAALAVGAPGAAVAATQQAREATLRQRSDAQLATLARRNEAEATTIGERLLDDDARRDSIYADRDAAWDLIGQFLAEAYKSGTSGDSGLVGDLLSAANLHEAADRVRVAQAVSEHHANLIRSLERAEARLEVSRFERSQLIARLAAVQAALVDVQAEQSRRAALRAEHAADRAALQEAAAAKRAREQQATLAAFAPAAGSLVASSFAIGSGGAPTAAGIDAYLRSKGSPMVGQGAAFMASGQRWRVDPRLLVAIAGAESSFGQITCGPHNAWGWACPNDPADFATWAAGIDTVTKGLRRYYLDEGRTSVSLIQQKYCPVGAANDPTGLNSHWTTNVTKFLREQGGNPARVGPGPGGAAGLVPDFGGLGIASS